MGRERFFPSGSEGKKNRPPPTFVGKMLKAVVLKFFFILQASRSANQRFELSGVISNLEVIQ